MGTKKDKRPRLETAQRDIVMLGIATAAIIMFVGIGGTVMPQVARHLFDRSVAPPDSALVNALLLNIALIIFGWRRYADLQKEIEQRREAEERAKHLSQIDPLTGCYNRRSATEKLMEALRAVGSAHKGAAFVMIDLDGFKEINDSNGHQAGDEVLLAIARRLKRIAPAGASVARLGGDEFAVIIPVVDREAEELELWACEMTGAIAKPIDTEMGPLEVTISAGIAIETQPQAATDMERAARKLMHRADLAMYHAKKEGRNRYCWFDRAMEVEARVRREMESAIRHGLERGEFTPHYEQQIDLETGKLVGFEMLARWNSAELGEVAPDIFIPVAENCGLIGPLSETLIRRALSDARSWHHSLTLSVNISAMQLRDPWFPQKLLKLLISSEFPPARLDVEISESCLQEDLIGAQAMILSLKNLGVGVSLDDFGTGFSTLTQLRSLPFDRVKIDKSFVGELRRVAEAAPGVVKNRRDEDHIVSTLVSLGKGLQIPVTAEGIEDASILETLRQMGEMKGQGYLYGRPEDAAAVMTRLRELDMLAEGNQPPPPQGEERKRA
ncbi:putative bifunctional diguanylate cyclase/phosphodiesterase [Alteriqipengyuania lutimaris]|uniref:EAL domain-containing protein n=1 Tax=Alteriqipengyuania lutimaris TaxID=1538146 RepID=A0A395LML0_9SPHN|nr:EAL domain-containing protein [Alteriqipengyuania lutimaris]MBB3032592.1 diguanylate cyclase (GGDEF)-like protein [Alteriqipengyuania lutimaris]RDS78286.1 EAL domain-containing protein [Alteriqipengyuania lutimaris]